MPWDRRRDGNVFVDREWWAMDLEWTRSTFCADKACVEVTMVDAETIAVRDSKNVRQPYLAFSRTAWMSFLDGLVDESFEVG